MVLVAALAVLSLAPAPPVGAPLPSTAAIVKGPYLQALGATGVTIKLEIDRPAPARVEVYLAGESKPLASPVGDGERSFHAIRVEGLSPATAYEYVVATGGVTSERGRFTTAPTDARPFRFIAYGDSRSHAEAHAAVVRAMEATPSDFLLNTGDIVAMGNQPRRLARASSPSRVACSVTAARSSPSATTSSRAATTPARSRSSTTSPARRRAASPSGSTAPSAGPTPGFFLLNAMDRWTGDERRPGLRAELDRALREPGLAHRIAVLHWGPFSSGPHGGNPALANGVVVAMMRERGVDLVLAGHDHAYERGEGRGLKYVITGGAGAELYLKKTRRRRAASSRRSTTSSRGSRSTATSVQRA